MTPRRRIRRVLHRRRQWAIVVRDCLRAFALLPDHSIDAVITDPPYPEIDRDYGRLSERHWHRLMRRVVAEVQRVLTPTGSAVFILQANQEQIGRTRPWLWEFMAWTAREWNQIQDVWWWNTTAVPTGHSNRRHGLLRPSVKACVWLGAADCYRRQEAVLWRESDHNIAVRQSARASHKLEYHPSGLSMRDARCTRAAAERGGVTPFNLLPIGNTGNHAGGHGAATPERLCYWWVRYLVPRHGVVLDPFCGSGTTGLACTRHGARFIGFERMREYARLARKRLRQATHLAPLFASRE